jgi:glycosyltransferase involved in cell wall biosynthesis
VEGTGRKSKQSSGKLSVLMLCAHEPTMDPRVRWTAEFAAREFDVTVLGFNREDLSCPPSEEMDSYIVVRLPRVDTEPREYLEYLRQIFSGPAKGAAALLAPAFAAGVHLGKKGFSLQRWIASFFPWHLDGGRLFGRKSPGDARERATATEQLAEELAYASEMRQVRTRFYYILGLLRMQFSPATSLFWNHVQQMPVPDVIHCNDLDTLLVGVLAKQHFGCRLVYDAHEFYPHCDPHGRWLDQSFFSKIEKVLIHRCDGVVTVNPPLADLMREAYGLEKVYAVPNAEPWVEGGRAHFSSRMSEVAADRIRFLFQGRFTPGRGIEEIVRGWAAVDRTRAALFLRGPHNPWKERAIELARSLGLLDESVYFLDAVTEDDLVSAAAEADVGIIPYLPLILNDRFACPNKLSQYMHAGLMLVANDLPYIRSVIEQGEVGRIYSSQDPATLAKVVDEILGSPDLLHACKANSSRFARESFNWQAFAWQLSALYRGETPETAQGPELLKAAMPAGSPV